MKKEITVTIKAPYTSTSHVKLEGNVLMFQNIGDSSAVLSQGWSLCPGGSLSLGSQTDINIVKIDEKLIFDNTDGTGRLEVMILNIKECT